MRIDGHTNLGCHPKSGRQSSKEHAVTVDELNEYLHKYGITHHLCLYEQDKHPWLVQLDSSITTWGCQAMYATWPDRAYEITEIPLDIGKPNVVGVKFHSHRGYWKIKGIIQSGLDYSNVKLMSKILDRLPDKTVVSMHVQGSVSFGNTSHSHAVAKLALKYPHLKFIINHAGDYSIMGFPPAPENRNWEGKAGCLNHLGSINCIQAALNVSDFLPNVFMDASVMLRHKYAVLKSSTKWVLGSDIPYSGEYSYSLDNQARNCKIPEAQLRQNELNFLEFMK